VLRFDQTLKGASMTKVAAVIGLLAYCCAAFAQRPSDPALLAPANAPALDYAVAPKAVDVPAGLEMGPPASAAFDSKGHLFVLTRGDRAFFEFDRSGAFVRAFGDHLFTRSHGLHIDRDDNLWATDVSAHVVMKLSPNGDVLLTLGTKGEAGEWNETTGSRRFDQPNDVAVAANGDVFVVQGHTPGPKGDPRVLKFDAQGRFIKSWGGKGTGPGQFQVAHAIAIDREGLLWVADRENQRVEIFTADGAFVREIAYKGLPCDLDIGRRSIFMVNGFAGQLLKLDLRGNVLAALGRPGKDPGEFGEAHMVAVSPKGEIYVADTVNATLTKFVEKQRVTAP
jgi:DNA-binding beta-propeller fold protein YncE